MVKATVVSKKCESAENKISSADTIKPHNSVIHGHRSMGCLIKVEKQLILFAEIYLWKTHLLVVLDMKEITLSVTNRILTPLLVTKNMTDLAEKECSFVSHHCFFLKTYQNIRDYFMFKYRSKISRQQRKHRQKMNKICDRSLKLICLTLWEITPYINYRRTIMNICLQLIAQFL